jgi:hypothetical protein
MTKMFADSRSQDTAFMSLLLPTKIDLTTKPFLRWSSGSATEVESHAERMELNANMKFPDHKTHPDSSLQDAVMAATERKDQWF